MYGQVKTKYISFNLCEIVGNKGQSFHIVFSDDTKFMKECMKIGAFSVF